MKKKKLVFYTLICLFLLVGNISKADTSTFVILSADELRDKIRGGLLGQLLGNLNGLEHEFKYFDAPGNVKTYTPALPNGAWADDDTDFEWVYIYIMQQENEVYLSPQRIAALWKERINQRIWCANLYARRLMDLGFEPPLTGNTTLNPWAHFNISGQFLCESFGLLAPAMPQTAAKIGLNYTRVAIDGEPAQTTQFFTAMIATAFVCGNIDKILDAGIASLDPASELHEIVGDVRTWYRQNPDNWRKTRQKIKEKYTRFGRAMRDKNGYELNTASVVAALLYGNSDPAETLLIAFNFGWDADCNAATAGTIVGVVRGYRWMLSQGWKIVDRYENKTRENMPEDETITSFADRLIDLAERVIIQQGGSKMLENGNPVYKIPVEKPANIQKLPQFTLLREQMRLQLTEQIESGLAEGATKQQQAKAAYLAICLGNAETIKNDEPEKWNRVITSLDGYPDMVDEIFRESSEYGVEIQDSAKKAGLKKQKEYY